MPTFVLSPHPDHRPPAGISMSVEAVREDGALKLLYTLGGDPEDQLVRVSPPGTGGRTNGLWEQTCFEAFIMPDGGPGYRELNFSPWGEWAAYEFSEGMAIGIDCRHRGQGRRQILLGARASARPT